MRALMSVLLLVSCGGGFECDSVADVDGDGLSECEEWELYLNPEIADSDGDGFDDGEELECGSDPADKNEVCYACGWRHDDPGDLTGVGSSEGDTIANIGLADACHEDVDLWDFAGSYHILFFTAEWCGVCKAEVNGHDAMLESFRSRSDVPADYLVILFQNARGGTPTSDSVVAYQQAVSTEGPILADPKVDTVSLTPYDGSALPGKCLVSPRMEMLKCWTGKEGDSEAFDMIEAHAAGG
mgnify:CR=1 FL=1